MTTLGTINWDSSIIPGTLLNLPQGFGQNYKIVTSVSSGNLTVALKTLAGTDPSATDPIYVRIGNTVRSITSAFGVTINAGVNILNLGSSELATKEVDLFVYLSYDSGFGVGMAISRIPYARVIGDFNITGTPYLNEKGYIDYLSPATSTNEVECIGRFNATLSAGAGYTWSIPATSVIVNRPIYETRWLDYSPQRANATMTFTSSFARTKYKISMDSLYLNIQDNYSNIGGVVESVILYTLPFTVTQSPCSWNLFENGAINLSSGYASFAPTNISLAKSGNFVAGQSGIVRLSGVTSI